MLYVIQTFDGLAQIQRLVRTVLASDPTGRVVISHNCDRFRISHDHFEDPRRVAVINMPKGNRVDFYQVEAYLAALDLAEARGFAYDWVINITGQCYPVRPLGELKQHLNEGSVDGYLFHGPVYLEHGALWPPSEAHARYDYHYLLRLTRHELPRAAHAFCSVVRELVNRSQRIVRIDTSYALQIGLRHRGNALPEGWQLYGGFYFMALSRRAAQRLRDFSQTNQRVVDHFRLLNLPSEVYAHTVLANDSTMRLSQRIPIFIDYADSKRGRPRVLSLQDVISLDSSPHPYYFARKFVLESDPSVFDWLDQRVLAPPLTQSQSLAA
jgi:hypothetical protein